MSKRVLVKDKYVHAMEYLHRHPEMIRIEWSHGNDPSWSSPGKHLFALTAEGCGCLTQVRGRSLRAASTEAPTEALTRAIRRDQRIPRDEVNIRPEHLNVFAEWQRRLDRELGEDR